MSNLRTNKPLMKVVGDFPTRVPKQDDFTEYVYTFASGPKTVISRSELSLDVDELMYEELKAEANNNRVQIENHRAYAKVQEKHDALMEMQTADETMEASIIQQLALQEAIQSLAPKQQQLLFKKYYQGISNTEIAREEGVTEGAIRDRLVKIHGRLKKEMQEKL